MTRVRAVLAAKATATILVCLAVIVCFVALRFTLNRMGTAVHLETCLTEILSRVDETVAHGRGIDLNACKEEEDPQAMFWATAALFLIGLAGAVVATAVIFAPRLAAARVRLTAVVAGVVFAGSTLGLGFRESVTDMAGFALLASAFLWGGASLCYEQQFAAARRRQDQEAVAEQRRRMRARARQQLRRAALRADS